MDKIAADVRHATDRRTLLQIAAATTAGGMLGLGAIGKALAQHTAERPPVSDLKIRLANEKYRPLYADRTGNFMQDPQWVKDTTERLTWPKAGEQIPDLVVYVPDEKTQWVDAMRKWANDAEQLGLKYTVNLVSTARWLEMVNTHRQDMELHEASIRPERVDPAEWLVSRAYGLDYRNYGEEVNEQYDSLVVAQNQESDPEKRLILVKQAQRVLCDDYYTNQLGWGPAISEPYNSGAFEGVVPVHGFGISSFSMFHSFINMTPKTSRKRLMVGSTTLLDTTNIIAATNTMRNVGRMIYDRLAFMSPDLKPIPWAAESWNRVDDKTWDLKLRSGMRFHDGKPVTISDLKFTFDFMLKYERAIYWTANQFLLDTKIVNETDNVLRFQFKVPYALFETYFLQINTILPKHIWEGIMQEQGTDNPWSVRIDVPVGSGPFQFGQYRHDVSLQLIANKVHFSRPKIDELWIVVVPSIDGILGRLASGELDMVDIENAPLSPSQLQQLDGLAQMTIVHTPDINWVHVINRISVLPWRDYEFRRAWMQAFDRDYLVNVAWEGGGRMPTSNTFLVEGNPWHNPDLPPIPNFDIKAARQILRDAGYGWASDGRLVYPSPTDQKFRERVIRVSREGYTWGGLKMLGT